LPFSFARYLIYILFIDENGIGQSVNRGFPDKLIRNDNELAAASISALPFPVRTINPCRHRGSARLGNRHRRFDRGLPFRRRLHHSGGWLRVGGVLEVR